MISSAVCSLLVTGLLPPDEEVCSGRWAGEVSGLGLQVPPTLGARPPERAREEYRVAFSEPQPLLRPIESCYKPWTTLPGAALPMARQKGWLGGDSASHLRALFRELWVEVPAEFAHAPDHLALELEFLGLLADSASAERCELFRHQHLDWVGDLARDAASRGAPPFYQDLLGLIARVVEERSP